MSANLASSPLSRASNFRLTRRKLGALSIPAVLGLSLSACGSGGGSGGGEGIRVVDYYTDANTTDPVEAALTNAVEEVGTSFTREEVPGENLIQQVLQMSSSNTMPDLLMLDNPDLQEIAQTGALLPLEDYGIDYSGYGQSILDTGTYEGTVYGLAPNVNTLALFYNVQLLEDAGVEPPSTWDELRQAAQELTGDGVYGISFCANSTYTGTWQFLPFMWSNGGDETDLAAPEVAEASQLWADLVNDGSASSSVVNWDQADAADQFKAIQAAMMVGGPWEIPGLESDTPDLEWDVVQIPVPSEGDTSVAPLGGEVWTIPNTGNEEQQQLAADVLKIFLNEENQLEMAAAQNKIPTLDSLSEQYADDNPHLAVFVEQVSNARARTGLLGADWPATSAAIYTANQEVLVNGVDPATAFENAAESVS